MMMENAPLERDIPTAVMMTQWLQESRRCGLQSRESMSVMSVSAGCRLGI